MAPKAKEKGFDNAKLQAMAEPLSIRIEKIKGSARQPMPMPGRGDGAAPGTGLVREDILKVEQFVLELAGGGYYEGKVTDANGQSMEWVFGWDPRVFPEKIPPSDVTYSAFGSFAGVTAPASTTYLPTASAPSPGAPMPASAMPLGGGGSVVSGPWPPPGLAASNYMGAVAMAPQAPVAPPPPAYVPTGGQGMAMQNGGSFNPFGLGSVRDREREREDYREREREREQREAAERIRAAEEAVRKAELEKKELEYKTLLDRQNAAHAQELASMREEMRRLADTKPRESDEAMKLREQLEAQRRDMERAQLHAIQEQMKQMQDFMLKMAERKPDGESETLRAMREQMERQRQEMEQRDRDNRDRLERDRLEREARDREMRLQQEQREAQARFERLLADERADRQRETQQLLQSLQPRQDPMIEVLRDQVRLAAEAARDKLNPLDLIKIVKDSNAGSDLMLRNIVDSFSGVFNTYRHAVESVAQLAPSSGPSPMVGILQDAISNGKEIAERWVDAQRDRAVAEARSKAEQAKAQAGVAQAQAQAISAQAHAQTHQGQGGGLAGASLPPSNGNAPVAAATPPPVAPRPAGWSPPPPVQPTTDVQPTAPRGSAPTDEQMFGVAYESVLRLRKGIETWLNAGGKPGPDGKVPGLSPDLAVDAILSGIAYCDQNKIVVPAFTLFEQGRFADLIDALIPVNVAPQEYRDRCVQSLDKKFNPPMAGGENDDDDDDEDDADDTAAQPSA